MCLKISFVMASEQRIIDVIVAMRDSFAMYLEPQVLLNFIPSLDGNAMQETLTYAVSQEPKDTMYRLLECLIHSDVSGSSQIEFYQILRLLGQERDSSLKHLISSEGLKLWPNVLDMVNLFVDLVEGHKFENVTCLTVQQVLAVLTRCKMVEVSDSSHEIIELKPLNAFMKILKSIKRDQPNWPFIVWDELKQMEPELFNSTDCRLAEENPSIFGSGVSDCGLSVANPSVSDGRSEFNKDFRLLVENPSIYGSEDCGLSVENPSVSDGRSAFNTDSNVMKLINRKLADTSIAENINPRIDWRTGSDVADYSDGDIDDDESYGAMGGVPDLKLRNYQLELAEEALYERNVIICAPTGCGKTRVAMHVIIKHLEKASEKNLKKVCVFIRTVPLAVQQYRVICKYLPRKYKAVLVTGDSVHCLNLAALLPENDVFVLTPMILQNHFDRGLLKDLTVFSLLVFDECHHTRKAEPYNTLMLPYLKMKINNSHSPLPQVLGLTASLPTEKADTVEGAMGSVLQICANLAADDISTVRDNEEELRNTVPDPQEDIKLLCERESEFVRKVTFIMRSMEAEAQREGSKIYDEEVIKQLKAEEIPADKKSQPYNQWTVSLRKAAEAVVVTQHETNMAVRIIMVLAKILMEYNIALEAYDLLHLQDVLSYLEKSFKTFKENRAKTQTEAKLLADFNDLKQDMDMFVDERNPNLTKLVEILETYLLSKGEQSRGIIFVKTRALAEALTSWLRKCGNDAIVKLQATIFTGTNASESEGGMTQAEQDACVESFRKGTTKLLVATSVAEEGIDVPECNLVIKYNYVGNEISTIQTKGRSRKQGGQSILLAMPCLKDRESKNKRRAKMMFEAVRKIQDMQITQRLEKISSLQRMTLEEQKLKELSKKEVKKADKSFKVLCKLCRKTCVDSDYVKIVEGTHRVVTDWNIWKHVTIKRMPPESIDDVTVIGSVRCSAAVESNAICDGVLGTAIIYKKTRFLALGIKNIVFVEKIGEKPQFFKQWKKVKYIVQDIELSDFARYIENSRGGGRLQE